MKYVWRDLRFAYPFSEHFSGKRFAVIIYAVQMLDENKWEKPRNTITFKFTLILNEYSCCIFPVLQTLISTHAKAVHGKWFQLQEVCSMSMLHCAPLFLHVNPSVFNSQFFSCLNSPNTAHHCGLIITTDTKLIQFPSPLLLLLWHFFCVRHAALQQSWVKCKLLWLSSYTLIFSLDVVGGAIQDFLKNLWNTMDFYFLLYSVEFPSDHVISSSITLLRFLCNLCNRFLICHVDRHWLCEVVLNKETCIFRAKCGSSKLLCIVLV